MRPWSVVWSSRLMKALRGKATDVRFPHKAAMIRKQGGSVWLSHRLAGLLSHSREAFRRLVIGPAEVGCDFVKQYLDDLVRQGKVLYVGISDARLGGSRRRTLLRTCGGGRPSSGCRSNTA